MKKKLKLQPPEKHQPGKCPVCGEWFLSYGGSHLEDAMMAYSWTCENCHSYGEEWYKLTFDQHDNVVIPDILEEPKEE